MYLSSKVDERQTAFLSHKLFALENKCQPPSYQHSSLSASTFFLWVSVVMQLTDHLTSSHLTHTFQSAYRASHSAETALLYMSLLMIFSQLPTPTKCIFWFCLMYRQRLTPLTTPYCCAAFGVSGQALVTWFQPYLSNRLQSVSVNGINSMLTMIDCGVPQGSVLGPILFVLYTQPLSQILSNHSCPHQFFSDTQLCKSYSPEQYEDTKNSLKTCICDTKNWITDNKFQLNEEKTETMLFNSTKLKNSPSRLSISQTTISFSDSARNLGFTR